MEFFTDHLILWTLYAGVGVAASQAAMGRLLRGNHSAPRSYFLLVGFAGLITLVAWPLVALGYANFLLAKGGHLAWMKLFK